MWQQPPQGGPQLYIPIERALLFRTTSRKNSPEGVSILRSAYRPWWLKRGAEDHEAIGIERDLAGLPIVSIPKKYLAPGASGQDLQFKQNAEKLARDIKMNSQAGVVLPSETFQNPDGSWSNVPMMKLELLSASSSRRMIETDPVIKRHNRLIAMSAMADFLTLGDDKGSYSLSANKSELFLRSCEAYLHQIASVVNRFLFPRIFRYNGIPHELLPTIKPGRLAPVDLNELGAYIAALAGAGAPMFPNQELSNYLADVAGLPEPPEDIGLMAKPGQLPKFGQTNPDTGEPTTLEEHQAFEQAGLAGTAFNENVSPGRGGGGGAAKKSFTIGKVARRRTPNPFAKYNENHDERGRFTFANGTGGLASAQYAKTFKKVTPDDIFNNVSPDAKTAAMNLEASLATRVPSDASVAQGGYIREDGTYTPERQAIHEALLDKIFTPEKIAAAMPPEGTPPTMTMLGGRGGSGKSFLTADGGPVDASKTIILNSDDFKGPLAKASGLDERYAALFHEESDHVLNMASARAKALRVNVAFDSTMKSEGTATARMLEYKTAGYNIEGHYVHTSPENAATRSIGRFWKGGAATGRYVPPSVILGNTLNEANFDKLSPNFQRWTIWDNNGAKPVLIGSGGKP